MSDQTSTPAVQPAATATDTLKPFKGAADADSPETFWDKLSKDIANLADVTVATLITNVTVGVDERGRLAKVTTPDQQVAAIITNVNLVDGNVTTVIGPDLKDDTAITGFHQGIVDKAVKVLPDNLKALITVVEGLLGRNK